MTGSSKLLFSSILGYVSAVSASQYCLGAVMNQSNIPAYYPGNPVYDILALPYNLRVSYKPLAIALPETTDDIVNALQSARMCGIHIQAKSGGHSFASYSSGGQDGSLVIDLQNFNEVNVTSDGAATVDGGVRVGNLDSALYEQSGRAVSHGTCPGMGVGGHFLHGGYGFESRMWGLAVDSITGLEAVIPQEDNATVVTYDTSSDPTMALWAFRGAADSFGVVTKLFLKTNLAPNSVVCFNFSIPGMYESAQNSARYFQHVQDFARNESVVDRKLTFGIYMDGKSFFIRGKYFGSQDGWGTIKAEMLRTLPEPTSDSTVETTDWLGSQLFFSDSDKLTQPLTGYNAHDDFFAKSVTVPEANPLTSDALNMYFAYIIANGTSASFKWSSMINLFGGPDSQINANPYSNLSSFPNRDSLWVVQHYARTPFTLSNYTNASFPSSIMRFVEGLNAALTAAMPGVNFGAYPNYIDPTLSQDQAKSLYYDAFPNGNETYTQLTQIKAQLDTYDLFWNPQSIPLPPRSPQLNLKKLLQRLLGFYV